MFVERFERHVDRLTATLAKRSFFSFEEIPSNILVGNSCLAYQWKSR